MSALADTLRALSAALDEHAGAVLDHERIPAVAIDPGRLMPSSE